MSSKLTESKKLAAEIYLAKGTGYSPYIDILGVLRHCVSVLGEPYTRCDWYLQPRQGLCVGKRVSVAEASRCFERDVTRWESAGRPRMHRWEHWQVFDFYDTNDKAGEEFMKIATSWVSR